MKSIATQVVAGIVYNQKGQILLSTRPKGKAYAGYWEFAGGKVEPNEQPLDALKREFQEELGIQILDATPYLAKYHVYEHATVDLRFYTIQAHQWQGVPTPKENQQIIWQNPHHISVEPILPANQHLFSVLRVPRHFSGSLKTGLYNDQQKYQIFPYLTDLYKENIMIEYEKLNHIKRLPAQANTWIIVHQGTQFQAAQDAFGIIWSIRQTQDADELMQILKNGASLPIIVASAPEFLSDYAHLWQALGVHAIVVDDEPLLA